MENNPAFKVLGVMSGTSLDGLDLALCVFREDQGAWDYEILAASTHAYPDEWTHILANLDEAPGRELWQVHTKYGCFIGQAIRQFLQDHGQSADLIASHGHTIFHKPELGYTLQIGDGANIAVASGIPVVCDFRSGDVAKKGQGAPLVPIGDALLFAEFAACVNLGGFSNISFRSNQQRIAFDICPANKPMNLLASSFGLAFDPQGEIARKGKVIPEMFEDLNALEYYHQSGPKSLGQEWFSSQFWPIIQQSKEANEDKLCTLAEHIAFQLGRALSGSPEGKVLLTGGGAHNAYLVERIGYHTRHIIHLPEDQIIDYKEALVFAFMGLLRSQGRTNCLTSVTGARSDSSLGALYLP